MSTQRQPAIRTSFLVTLAGATVLTLTIVTTILTVSPNQFFAQAQNQDLEEKVLQQVSNTESSNNARTHTVHFDVLEYTDRQGGRSVQHVQSSSDATFVLYRDDFVGFAPIKDLIGYSRRDQVIRVNGEGVPNAEILLTLGSEKDRVYETQASAYGSWVVLLQASELPAGTYHATVRSSVNGVVSDTFVAGTFTVDERKVLSNSTWMALVFVSAGTVLFLLLVNVVVLIVQRRRRRAGRTA